ncbi:transposase, IS605 family protein [Scytonema sp. HK-05]|uniref:transposase n=1 Tax=Scytonema sp. HK-05 TaxID=1137095 RepID=UPI0009369AAD|nr:transposase [Scytonema sp. HK-05]OKH57904.1 transposase [Scytonema sp. HK-05]BAY44030.1 transposase, IS605 family protein [Scytonema sp. HK-05]
MARSTTLSFITEVPLIVDSKQEAELLSRFQAGRQLYNACLNEAMKRLELVGNSELYKSAKKIFRTQKKERCEAFKKAREQYRYSEYDLHAFATITSKKSKWIAEKIDSNTQQKLATRAFKASERVMLGVAKDVRYKVPSRFRSMEGKSNKTGIRWKDNCLVWGKLMLKPVIDPTNLVIRYGLESPVKYVRLLWRILNGKRRWYAQMINEGLPYQKPQNYVSDGLIGLDLNISNIAFVGDKHADLLAFAPNVPTFHKEIAVLQRKMQRSQRTNNPDNFEPNFIGSCGRKTVVKKGKVKKNSRKWNKSNNYRKAAAKKRELERRKTAYAKNQNRRVINEILRHGKDIKTENVSVKGWQKRYGKAIAAKSPGFVQSELIRKAEKAGGTVIKFSTQKTALSQTHLNGERIKKTLSQRVHIDRLTGEGMHRDLFSAFLAKFVNQDELSLQDAVEQYPRSKSILFGAWRRFKICEISRQVRTPVPDSRQSRSQRRQKKLAR